MLTFAVVTDPGAAELVGSRDFFAVGGVPMFALGELLLLGEDGRAVTPSVHGYRRPADFASVRIVAHPTLEDAVQHSLDVVASS